ncbi:MAG: hypothetical protein NVS3B18_06430 [Candidatus Dormibacteria bacterium]
MPRSYRVTDRDRAFRRIAYYSAGGVLGAAGLTGAISAASAASFAAANPKPVSAPVPVIPVETAPAQSVRPTPAVIVQIIHVSGGTVYSGGTLSRPRHAPSAGGSSSAPPPPPAPPAPACHSTPSHPC